MNINQTTTLPPPFTIQYKEAQYFLIVEVDDHLFTWYIEVGSIEVLPRGHGLTLLVLGVPVTVSEGEQKNAQLL